MRVVIITRAVAACQMAFYDRLASTSFAALCNQERIQVLLLNGFVNLVNIMHAMFTTGRVVAVTSTVKRGVLVVVVRKMMSRVKVGRYATKNPFTCPLHALAYEIECNNRAAQSHNIIHPELGKGHSNLYEASHNVLIRFRSKNLHLHRLHYITSTNLGLC